MRHDDMMPTHSMRNSAAVAALAARVSAGDAGGAGGSIIGQQGPSCRCCNVVHVCGCGCAQLCLEPCSGCRCMSVLHVAVCCGGRVAQLWHWGQVCTVLRVCWLEMGPRVRVELSKSGIVSVALCRLRVGYGCKLRACAYSYAVLTFPNHLLSLA
jgi:hypothetical protein